MTETNQTVVFVGLGYIGLPTAVTLANSGVRVKGVPAVALKGKAVVDTKGLWR